MGDKMFALIAPKSSSPAIRIGHLSLSPAFPQSPTPVCFQYTRNGCVPHLTWDLVPHVQDDESPILTSVPSVFPFVQQLQSLHTSLHNFCRLPQRPVFLSTYDCTTAIRHGGNDRKGISFKRQSGCDQINNQGYMDLVSHCQPQAFQSLCDADTPIDASNKRISHSVKRSQAYLDELRMKQADNLMSVAAPVFGSIVGGYDLRSRLISCSLVSEKEVDGYVIEGLHDYDSHKSQVLLPEAHSIIEQVLHNLPVNAPKAIFGCLKPETMFQLMKLGIDIFDSSYATALTDSGKALIVRIAQNHDSEVEVHSSVMDLKSGEYREDMSIISSECACYACSRSFSRAYLNHLLVTKEMLASVLLNLHNLYTMYRFFREIRSKFMVL